MLTPEEIQSREFLVSLRGYDRDEVHAFLGRVAEQLAETEAKAAELQQRLGRLTAEEPAADSAPAGRRADAPVEPSAMFAEIGKETQRILEAAQEAAQQMQRKVRQDADREVQSARGQAAKLIAEGERRREHIERTVAELEEARAAMADQLRRLGRTIDETLRELAPADEAATLRKPIGEEATSGTQRRQQEDEPVEDVAIQVPHAPAEQADNATAVASTAAAPAPDDHVEAPAALATEPTRALDDDDAPARTTEPTMPRTEAMTPPDGPPDPQRLRAAALSALHPKLVRKVKRELQELQNIALDRLRRAKGKGAVDDFLPADQDTEGLGEGTGALLRQAWEAGVSNAAVLAERELGGAGRPPDLADGFRRDASERVRSGLAATLRMGLSADEGPQALSDRLGAVFAELKAGQAEDLAATHLILAYESGLLDAWSSGGVRARRWVLGREPRCPEGRCRYNVQGGPLPVGESFASGHDTPPVHVGCTCTTVPAEE